MKMLHTAMHYECYCNAPIRIDSCQSRYFWFASFGLLYISDHATTRWFQVRKAIFSPRKECISCIRKSLTRGHSIYRTKHSLGDILSGREYLQSALVFRCLLSLWGFIAKKQYQLKKFMIKTRGTSIN